MRLYDLYIIYRDGRSIYHKSFCHTSLDASIISGFLSALSDFAKEALPSEGMLKVIEKGNIKVVFSHGRIIHMALISETEDKKDIIYLNNRLLDLTEKLETEYSEALKDWGGNIGDFEGIDTIVSDVFREGIRLSSPPNIKELADKKNSFFFSTDEDGINIYEAFYKSSQSFSSFLGRFNITASMVEQILNRLKSTYVSFNEIKEEYNIDEETLLKLLRNLALRGILSVCV